MTEFWTPQRRRFWAIAAALILLSAGVVAGVYLVASRPGTSERAANKGELSAFLSDEHKAAFREGTKLEQKFPVKDPVTLASSMREWVGKSISWEELFPGGQVKFLGAGKSAVPGAGSSVQLRISASNENGSVFIQQYRKKPELEDGGAWKLPGRNLGEGAPPILVWRRGGLVYYLVAENGAAMGLMREGMKAPQPNKQY